MSDGIQTIVLGLLICVPVIVGLSEGPAAGVSAFFVILLIIMIASGGFSIFREVF